MLVAGLHCRRQFFRDPCFARVKAKAGLGLRGQGLPGLAHTSWKQSIKDSRTHHLLLLGRQEDIFEVITLGKI